jgi:hypothetical protein
MFRPTLTYPTRLPKWPRPTPPDRTGCAEFICGTIGIPMRRGIAIVLTMLFSWLLILPALGGSTDLTVPACCRKNGKHHCMMRMAELSNSGTVITTIAEKCPCGPQATVASHTRFCTPSVSQAVFAGLIRHPAVSPQTEASYRISYDRARQKRGPPSLILC